MNMIGEHIVFFQEDRRTLQEPFTRGAIGAIGRVDARYTQNAAAHTRFTKESNGIFRINPPNGSRGVWLNRSRFRHPLALTIAKTPLVDPYTSALGKALLCSARTKFKVRESVDQAPARSEGGGAKCSTRVAQPDNRCNDRESSKLPTTGVMP